MPPSSRLPLPSKRENRSSSKGLDDDGDEVELGHHHGLTVAARPGESPTVPPGGASASAPLAPTAPAPHAQFYLEEYDHDLYGAPFWAWPRVS